MPEETPTAIRCARCGLEAERGRDLAESEQLARVEGFQQRGGVWVCPDCAGDEARRMIDTGPGA